jgi:DNA-binding NarL/FixJ family response regulator
VKVPALSVVEQEVVRLVIDGHTVREVAATLHLSVPTVEWHVARASRKLEQAAALHGRMRDAGAVAAREEARR